MPLLNSGRVELLDLPLLTAQLCGLERRTARGGRDSIDHALGVHDDIANAVADVLVHVANKSAPIGIAAEMHAQVRGRPAYRQSRASFF